MSEPGLLGKGRGQLYQILSEEFFLSLMMDHVGWVPISKTSRTELLLVFNRLEQ